MLVVEVRGNPLKVTISQERHETETSERASSVVLLLSLKKINKVFTSTVQKLERENRFQPLMNAQGRL